MITKLMAMSKFETKYKLVLIKKYFDTGYGLTSPLKWGLAIVGATLQDIELIKLYGIIYIILCFVAGWAWIKWDFYTAEQEVNNRLNLFQKEMRKVLLSPNK